MTLHHILMPPTRNPQPPTCSCGWAAPLPLACTWAAWEKAAAAHMAGLVDCPVHGVQERNGRGRCRGCASDRTRRAWEARRTHYPKGTP